MSVGETPPVRTGMKQRWIGGVLMAATLTLAACAPSQGAGESASDSEAAAPESIGASASAEPMESEAAAEASPSESAEPTPDDYEY